MNGWTQVTVRRQGTQGTARVVRANPAPDTPVTDGMQDEVKVEVQVEVKVDTTPQPAAPPSPVTPPTPDAAPVTPAVRRPCPTPELCPTCAGTGTSTGAATPTVVSVTWPRTPASTSSWRPRPPATVMAGQLTVPHPHARPGEGWHVTGVCVTCAGLGWVLRAPAVTVAPVLPAVPPGQVRWTPGLLPGGQVWSAVSSPALVSRASVPAVSST